MISKFFKNPEFWVLQRESINFFIEENQTGRSDLAKTRNGNVFLWSSIKKLILSRCKTQNSGFKKFLGLITFSLLFTPFDTYAIVCPNNFNQINVGDSLEQVKSACGKPDKEEKKETKQKGPEEWSYFIPKSFASSTTINPQTTLKVQVVFDETGKAVNITVNGIGVGSTTLCGTSISSGDTQETVQAACGKPTFINTQENSGGTVETTKTIEWTYNTSPPSVLIFENGKFKEKK